MKRYWIYRKSDGEQIAGPFDTEESAAMAVQALNEEAYREYEYR